NNVSRGRPRVGGVENFQSAVDLPTPSRSLAKVRARSRPVLIAAIRASIAAARRNFRRPRDTSRQTRSQERSSPEENRSSPLPLKPDNRLLEVEVRKWSLEPVDACLKPNVNILRLNT